MSDIDGTFVFKAYILYIDLLVFFQNCLLFLYLKKVLHDATEETFLAVCFHKEPGTGNCKSFSVLEKVLQII